MVEELLIQALGFIVLFLILRQVAWKRLLSVLDERRARIEAGFRQISQDKAHLEGLEQEFRQRLSQIDDEARAKIQQAVLEGKRIGIEIQEEARAQAREVIAKSKETMELELAKAKVTLRDQLAEMTIEAVERLLRQKLDEKSDRQLVDAVLEELERAKTP